MLRFGAAATTAVAATAAGAAAFPASASAAQVVGDTSGPTNPAVKATNPTGPALQLVEMPAAATAPFLAGNYPVGSFVNYQGILYQCYFNDGNVTEWVSSAATEIVYLASPVRIYSSRADTRGRLASGQIRSFDVTKKQDNVTDSGVPAGSLAVLTTMQIDTTSATTGWLSVAAKGGNLNGFSSVVWGSANFAGVTPVTSSLSADTAISVKCNNGSTHLFIDVIGFQISYVYQGSATAGSAPAPGLAAGPNAAYQRYVQRRNVARRSLSR
jgi:hypothetical protein